METRRCTKTMRAVTEKQKKKDEEKKEKGHEKEMRGRIRERMRGSRRRLREEENTVKITVLHSSHSIEDASVHPLKKSLIYLYSQLQYSGFHLMPDFMHMELLGVLSRYSIPLLKCVIEPDNLQSIDRDLSQYCRRSGSTMFGRKAPSASVARRLYSLLPFILKNTISDTVSNFKLSNAQKERLNSFTDEEVMRKREDWKAKLKAAYGQSTTRGIFQNPSLKYMIPLNLIAADPLHVFFLGIGAKVFDLIEETPLMDWLLSV
ncbi:hypothetical protein ADUPG1_007123 [Aduncisulcus paluster]|uniref:Uncharacterized protein n=1 Tax=Aduncisulcus paluster TaxID=2918883 RepID=A0ABQ5KNL6_9EUKA|nr:hypothetical protein ADUPG1_007123 [Aduncisulcus paluster]